MESAQPVLSSPRRAADAAMAAVAAAASVARLAAELDAPDGPASGWDVAPGAAWNVTACPQMPAPAVAGQLLLHTMLIKAQALHGRHRSDVTGAVARLIEDVVRHLYGDDPHVRCALDDLHGAVDALHEVFGDDADVRSLVQDAGCIFCASTPFHYAACQENASAWQFGGTRVGAQ